MARDSAATQQRIIAAATVEFAAHGISGARVDEIAARADVNKGMLYYYFGSKELLFREILKRKLAERVAQAAELGERTRTERVVQRQADHIAEKEYIRLLMWEALEAGADDEVEGESGRREVYAGWIDSTSNDQENGQLPQGLDPRHFVLSEIALTLIPAAFPQITRLIFGTDIDDPEFLESRQEFLAQLYAKFADE